MKLCVCGNTIPVSKVIDGKRRILKNRTRCFDCLPFKQLRSPLPDDEQKRRKIEKRRRWYAKIMGRLGTDPKSFRGGQRKLFIVEKLGGGCSLCSYRRCVRNLSFHHMSDKTFVLPARTFKRSLSELLPEITKCLLLCANCHGEVHDHLHEESTLTEKLDDVRSKLSDLQGKTWEEFGLTWSISGLIREPSGV